MPHFIVDCSPNVLAWKRVDVIMKEIHDTADASGLFKPGDIKVRLRPYEHSTVGGERKDFIHVFAHIMEGRTVEQRADLSRRVVTKLKEMFPDVPVVAMNVYEFEKATYCNLAKL